VKVALRWTQAEYTYYGIAWALVPWDSEVHAEGKGSRTEITNG